MRLLILGSTGPYPERLSAFTNAGHQLWYVSTEKLQVGSGQISGIPTYQFEDLGATPADAAKQVVKLIQKEKIEAVYSLLNVWDGSNRATAALLEWGCPIPVIRHYKEHYHSPSEDERKCLEKSTGVIFINEASRAYFASCYHLPQQTVCLDADLIPCCYLSSHFQAKLSLQDGAPHLLIAGSVSEDNGRYDYREWIDQLTNAGAHVHLYAQFRKLTSSGQLNNTNEVSAGYQKVGKPGFVHFHKTISPEQFVEEWSRYDAGLLHVPREDDPFRTLNMPNRYSAYLAAGVPVALPDGAMPAMQRQLEQLGVGIIYKNIAELVERLPDASAAARARAVREEVTFEAVFPKLMAFISSCL